MLRTASCPFSVSPSVKIVFISIFHNAHIFHFSFFFSWNNIGKGNRETLGLYFECVSLVQFILPEMRTNLRELQDEIECLRTQSMTSATNLKWHERTQAEAENWETARGLIFEKMIETEAIPVARIECHFQSCTKQGSICCLSCNCYMCSDCDTDQQCMMPLRDRNSWLHGYFEKLSPNETVVCNEEGTFTLNKKGMHIVSHLCITCTGGTEILCVTKEDSARIVSSEFAAFCKATVPFF